VADTSICHSLVFWTLGSAELVGINTRDFAVMAAIPKRKHYPSLLEFTRRTQPEARLLEVSRLKLKPFLFSGKWRRLSIPIPAQYSVLCR